MTSGFVDIHCHAVFGVDDGAKDFEEMQSMLRLAHEQGVEHVICTSHATPGIERFPVEDYLSHLQMAQTWCTREGLPIQVHSGCEILYTDSSARMVAEGFIPTLAEGWTVLVEFGPDTPYERMKEAARLFGVQGYNVVFAHIERYEALRSTKKIEELRNEYGVTMQMNSHTVYAKKGFFEDRWVKKVLEHGLIDVIGSDAHNVSSRPCHLQKAYDYLCSHFDEEYADQLCSLNARKLLKL